MYQVKFDRKFFKDVKLCRKRGLDINLLNNVIRILEEEGTLPQKYKPHKLVGDYAGCWECHIKPDWLLVWRQNDTELILLFIATGTHSDLF